MEVSFRSVNRSIYQTKDLLHIVRKVAEAYGAYEFLVSVYFQMHDQPGIRFQVAGIPTAKRFVFHLPVSLTVHQVVAGLKQAMEETYSLKGDFPTFVDDLLREKPKKSKQARTLKKAEKERQFLERVRIKAEALRHGNHGC